MTFAPLPCHLIRNPAGTYHFVGRVPDALAFVSSDPAYTAAAKHCGPGIAARIATAQGGTFRSLSWVTEAEAYAAAVALGYAVPQSAECDAAIAAIETDLVASGAIEAPVMVPQQVQQQQANAAPLQLFIATVREGDLTFTRRIQARDEQAAYVLIYAAEPRADVLRMTHCGQQDHRLHRTVGAMVC